MTRSSRSKPAEELVELPEDEALSEEDAPYSGHEEDGSSNEEEEDDEDAEDIPAAKQDDDEEEEVGSTADDQINPYEVLGVSKDATFSQIKKVYHKAALRHHPDKVSPDLRSQADAKFKEIAFAYSILSDEKKRKFYDSTGRTHGEASDLDWSEFMANQYKVAINEDVIANVKREYVGSEEERRDVLKAYKRGKGSWTTIFEEVMLSVMLDAKDEKRFRGYIDAAIGTGEVKAFKAYHESEGERAKRLKRAEREAKEAEKALKKMGVKQDPSKMTEDELAVLIRSRQPDTFAKLDDASSEALARHYEEKYSSSRKVKDRKRKSDVGTSSAEPSEAEFQAAQERIKQRKK